MAVTPFQVHIPDEELTLLSQKLKLARIPTVLAGNTDDNGITSSWLQDTVNYWLNTYDWRAEEAEINRLPQFTTPIEVSDDVGTLSIHFVHSKSSKPNAVPLLFLHGWPGSFIEVTKGLKRLNDEGFHVVAPSLPGYGFSEYPKKPERFDLRKVAEVAQKLMIRLGYQKFCVQGGDWGSHISRLIARDFPDNVFGVHTNMFEMSGEDPFKGQQEPEYSDFEKIALKRAFEWFRQTNTAYSFTQATKPNTLGIALHDSPVGMLAWMHDKLVLWTDDYPWTQKEVITWTLLHYLVGPTTSLYMYRDSWGPLTKNEWFQGKTEVPFGVSAFPKELMVMPRSWVETKVDLRLYREHARGGHFAMHEKPDELIDDMLEFYRSVLGS